MTLMMQTCPWVLISPCRTFQRRIFLVGLSLFIQKCTKRSLTDDSSTTILSESSIQNARQKRNRLRATANEREDDFISLSVTKRSDEYQGPHPESRLMREDDDLGDGDDGMFALSFTF
jgi:Nineteen complex-related protein 2